MGTLSRPFRRAATSRRGTGRASANGASGAASGAVMPCPYPLLAAPSGREGNRGWWRRKRDDRGDQESGSAGANRLYALNVPDMPGMTTPSASTYAFTAHRTAGGHIRVRVAPDRRQREDSAGIVAWATWASPLPVMPGYPGPQVPASGAQINQHRILAARRTKKEHQRQNESSLLLLSRVTSGFPGCGSR